eukprot:6480873-Alexandrium_andersonii.AAC.1
MHSVGGPSASFQGIIQRGCRCAARLCMPVLLISLRLLAVRQHTSVVGGQFVFVAGPEPHRPWKRQSALRRRI